jgi:hypothetical protein
MDKLFYDNDLRNKLIKLGSENVKNFTWRNTALNTLNVYQKVIKENKQRFLITPTTLTNNTKDTLKYYSMSCSWQDFYSVDSKELQVDGQDCDKNIPIILTLAPGESKTVEIRLLMDQTIYASEIKFKIGFNLMKVSSTQKEFDFDFNEQQKKKNIIWSNIISR